MNKIRELLEKARDEGVKHTAVGYIDHALALLAEKPCEVGNIEEIKKILSDAFTEYRQAYRSNETDETLIYPRDKYPDIVSYQTAKVMEYICPACTETSQEEKALEYCAKKISEFYGKLASQEPGHNAEVDVSEYLGIGNQDLLEVYRTLFNGIPFIPFSVARELYNRLEATEKRADEAEAENKLLKKPLEACNFKVDGMLAVGQKLIDNEMEIKQLQALLRKHHICGQCEKG